MGTQGLLFKYPATGARRDGAWRPHFAFVVLFSAMASALGGCSSSFSSPSWSSSSQAAVPVQPPPPQAASADDPRASIYPQRSLVQEFAGSTSPTAAADPSYAGYPSQPLITTSGSAQSPNMPHPPNSYTASAQPYTPGGQPAYAPPASNQKAYAAPAQQYAATPPPAPPAQATPHISGYPDQSLFDLFHGSTEPQAQTVPRPPGSYTPSAQPYSPPAQPAYGAPQAPAPAGATTAAASPPPEQPHISGYPTQSIGDIFR
jgi:hypothetical protein